MVNKVRTLEFLPEIFRTDTNSQFLSATLDVITSQPDLKRVQGFIGRKYGYGVEPTDRYVVEPSKSRADYQLEPSVIFLKPETQVAQDFISYPGILNALENQGGLVNNQERLFENEFYSWDSFTNLDMLVNYSQYYWLPNGPDAVEVSPIGVSLNREFTVLDSDNGFEIEEIEQTNPSLTLIRGGTYKFKVNQKTKFWIQGIPGLNPIENNIDTREVFGVTNNGAEVGEIVFTVPFKTAQAQYDLPGELYVDLVSTESFDNINGKTISEIGSIDGVTQINGKTLMFYDNGELETQYRFYSISVDPSSEIVTLNPPPFSITIPFNEKITVTNGIKYLSRNFYRDLETNQIKIIPYLSSILDRLYYQDGTDPNSVGTINLIDDNQSSAIYISDILGKKNYTSPNGVQFINGLKVIFSGRVIPESYFNNEYYVEGVGSSINLIPLSEMLSVESQGEGLYNPWDISGFDTSEWDQSLFVPVFPEYFTINRNSIDRNAWSRANRWFNVQVLNATEKYNGQVTTQPFNQPIRAQRPIIEFEPNLALFNAGHIFSGFVDLFDTTTTNAFDQVVGQQSYMIDGEYLRSGQRVIFNADTDSNVRKTIYEVGFASLSSSSSVITLTPVSEPTQINSQIYVVYGNSFSGTAWHYTGESWVRSQTKTSTNQYPLFDIFDINGNSIGDNFYYPGTTFTGTKLYSYTPGTGADDPVLGIPISYSSGTAIGDINFTVNFNSDTFIYNSNSQPLTQNINIGFVHSYLNNRDYDVRTGWVTAVAPSVQYQVFQYEVTVNTKVFTCDIPAKMDTPWNNVIVYVNDNVIDTNEYTVVVNTNTSTTTVTLNVTALSGDEVTILVLSDKTSANAYYQIPSNLENNPFNDNITSVNVGDLKNQYQSIFNNAPGVTGKTFGINNIYNLGSLVNYGTSIIQNSSSLVLPGVFLRKPDLNIFESLIFNSDEYTNYKTQLIDVTNQNDFSVYQSPADILDTVIYQISSVKNSNNSFFWSDMLFSGSPYRTNTYSFTIDTTTASFPLGRVYNFTSANYFGLAVYLARKVNNIITYTQLIKNVDYQVDENSPAITITYSIKSGDSITIKEYNQTYGSYCPNTPTKLGLYPSFIPNVILDNTYTTPTYFILGHDGSYNKLYGTYVDGRLTDLRDMVLLEFEKRIYNNLKVVGDIPLVADEVIPGEFRKTQYSREEILDIYSLTFLRWVGKNRIDYKSQVYNIANPYTYNYNQSSSKVNGSLIKQGYWRGIYEWFYDTSDPANSPWEMLGLENKPSWWDSKYGVAPYTSDNTIMWEDISKGYIWNNGNPYVNPLKVRPGLLNLLPVNSGGQLLDPLQTVIGLHNNLTFNRPWIVGDQAPAETSYLRSSSWPFDLMRLLALTKPANFFNLFVDRDLYKYDTDLEQYLYDSRYHLNPKNIQVYGNGTAKHSYINWVVDYINQRGLDGTNVVTTTLQNLDVRLTYNAAGFTAKNYLKFLIEKSTVNTQNSSLLIPDNSYSILLYDNVPQEKITYSSVIVQKTNEGYTVWGNSQDKPYFTVSVPKPGLNNSFTVNSVTVNVNKNYFEDRVAYVPYGTIFYSVQGVCEFLNSYGNYLTTQGLIFDFIDSSVTYDWTQMIREFMYWSQQSWEVGSVINMNPSSLKFTVNREGLVVQPLTLQKQNFMLNQNLIPIQNQNVNIVRENEKFKVEVLSPGDSIAYTNLNLSSMEHAIVFDNYTVFNDTIYNLTTGLRQNRLLLQGYKSGEWNGFVDASGFILNEDNVKEWEPNVKYSKGKIVTYKGKYWIANRLIEAEAIFSEEKWQETDYDQIKTGLLPNPSTMAYESLYYYDSYVANLENDADLLSYSLIGYRPRQYLADADLSDITQVNVYKNIIREKGTNLIANAFKKADLIQGQIDYDIKENWAIKTATFGSILNNNYVEVVLDQNKLTGNPTLIGFTNSPSDINNVQQTVNLNQIINYERPPITPNFLPLYNQSYLVERGLPSAGYVNLNDAKLKAFELLDLNDDVTNIENLYRGDTVWLASYRGSWQAFTPQTVNTQVSQVLNNLNGTITIEFNQPHGLVSKDPILVFNFDLDINGYYSVIEVPTITSIVVANNLSPNRLVVTGQGLCFKLVSARFSQASDIVPVKNSEFYTKRVWVDSNSNGDWAVWESGPLFKPTGPTITPSQDLGTSVTYSSKIGYVIGDSSTGSIVRYNDTQLVQTITVPGSSIGEKLIAVDDWLFASDSAQGKILVYQLGAGDLSLKIEVTIDNTGMFAVSSDKQWLYVSDTRLRRVFLFALNSTKTQYNIVNAVTGPATATNFGEAISTSQDGVKLIVGASEESVDGITASGKTYIYTRGVNRILVTSTSKIYSISSQIPQGIADVYVDGELITNAIVNQSGVIELPTAPSIGSVITVNYGTITLVQTMFSGNLTNGGRFGKSLSTNKYGAEIVIGAPYDISTVNNVKNVEGSVYRWTNPGQKYGKVVGKVTGEQFGLLYVDGYPVTFNGNVVKIAEQINQQTPTNIIATVSGDHLIIGVLDNTVEVINNILDVTSDVDTLNSLGIVPYVQTQIINDINLQPIGEFGWEVAMNQRDGLLINARSANKFSETTFDFIDDINFNNDTIFDNGATTFIDQFLNIGTVSEYTYLPAANENIDNTGKYVFSQFIQINDTIDQSLSPAFGTSLWYDSNIILVGSPNWYSNGNGRVDIFSSTKSGGWWIDKTPLPQVDVNKLNNISIYNVVNNENLSFLDYIDPVQGKLLGAVESNLDYIGPTDPAQYFVGVEWTEKYVGKTWLDTTNLRMLNYNQPDIVYNASNWGTAFPGSTADIYTWIESTVTPTLYAGPGIISNLTNYTSVETLDDSTNTIKTLYYFWVKNYNEIPKGKTLSPITLSQYILNPQSSGISYLTGITTNTVALYNCADSIQSNTSILHLGYSSGNGADQGHELWDLIQSNQVDSFLTGLPKTFEEQPSSTYLKFLDSFAGEDQQGRVVPDPRLPILVRSGVSFRPRQSMFRNRLLALENYIDYANEILSKFPITESRSLYFLNQVGPGYDTRKYWNYIDWWAPGYGPDTKIILEVETVSDLQTLVPQQLIPGSQNLVITLEDGLVVRVNTNKFGNSEVWIWFQATGWVRIGLQNGTIEISSLLWQETTGWDGQSYDTNLWGDSLAAETYWIIRWLNEEVYINDLQIERNNSLMLMFNLIQSESLQDQNYLDWLNKTSLIDVSHRVRDLFPYKKFQRDNQEFLEGYLNEIKPYHVKIKDFSFKYDGIDVYPGNITDFDLPAQYNANTGKFETPMLSYKDTDLGPNEYSLTSPIWQEQQYNQWYENYGLSISSSELGLFVATELDQYLTKQANIIYVKDVNSLPETGTIFIGQEQISYNSLDPINNTIRGIDRGINSSIVDHLPGESVRIKMPDVIVLDQGRGYSAVPVVTAYIDTDIYPEPRVKAVLQPVMAADRVIGVTVVNPGSGYAVIPSIRITPSVTFTFNSSNINLVYNTITIENHQFVTGDSVVFTHKDGAPPSGLKDFEYYYVRKITNNTIALYTTYAGAFNTDKFELTDKSRVVISSLGSASTVNSLGIAARAVCFTNSQPVRELATTIKFDRTSYGSIVTDWQGGDFYAGILSDITKIASSTLKTSSDWPWDSTKWDATSWSEELLSSSQGAIFTISSNPYSVAPDNNGNVIVELDYSKTVVSPGQLNGQQLSFYKDQYIIKPGTDLWDNLENPWDMEEWDGTDVDVWIQPEKYYAKVITSTKVSLFYDPLFNYPVKFDGFKYTATDPVLLPEPFFFDRSLVKYAGKLWRCVVSNNDTVFDYDKWEQILSDNQILNAADRVLAFYQPTSNMTGVDLRQLMTGIEYPNTTIQGQNFNFGGNWDVTNWDNTPWSTNPAAEYDTDLISPDFNYDPITNPTIYDVQGGNFTDGYGPEELVPGLVTDQLNFTVITSSDPATYDPPLIPETFLNFRISVNKGGMGEVYNINPYTQTRLSSTFISTGNIDDVIKVDDVNKLVIKKEITVVTDSTGLVVVSGVTPFLITYLSIDLPNIFTWQSELNNNISMKIEGITQPTQVVVTIAEGNMMLVNNEFIGFTSVDFDNNTVTGLQRGRNGTITNSEIPSGALVQSVLNRDKLPQQYYNNWWYGSGGWSNLPWSKIPGWSYPSTFFAGTLYESVSEPAEFLKKTQP